MSDKAQKPATFMEPVHLPHPEVRARSASLEGRANADPGLGPNARRRLSGFVRTLRDNGFTYAMLHELAHYTGPTANGVDDHAYFHKNPHRYRSLSAEEAFRNADSYSQFAFDVTGRPDFNIELDRT